MAEYSEQCWGIIPARGGSKSIPLKNMAVLGDRPMMDYVIRAGKACRSLDRLICSTEDERIMDHCRDLEVEVHRRPERLAGDRTHVADVIRDLLSDLGGREGALPFAFALLQPTSPFVLPRHIEACVKALRDDPKAGSSQTISRFPHNFHAFNQRVVEDGYVRFNFEEERKACWNKQTKPVFFAFGNLVVTRTATFMDTGEIFATPSVPVEVEFPYSLDVDGPLELKWAELLVRSKNVELP